MNAKQTIVQLGSTVTVRREFATERVTYQISGYTDLARNVVSAEHPLGKGLLNHEKGDKVLIDDPRRHYFVEILDIKNPSPNS